MFNFISFSLKLGYSWRHSEIAFCDRRLQRFNSNWIHTTDWSFVYVKRQPFSIFQHGLQRSLCVCTNRNHAHYPYHSVWLYVCVYVSCATYVYAPVCIVVCMGIYRVCGRIFGHYARFQCIYVLLFWVELLLRTHSLLLLLLLLVTVSLTRFSVALAIHF